MTTWLTPVRRDDSTLFDWGRMERWEAGCDAACVRSPRMRCRYQPCTATQDVDCCVDCLMCGSPCRIAKGAKKCRR